MAPSRLVVSLVVLLLVSSGQGRNLRQSRAAQYYPNQLFANDLFNHIFALSNNAVRFGTYQAVNSINSIPKYVTYADGTGQTYTALVDANHFGPTRYYYSTRPDANVAIFSDNIGSAAVAGATSSGLRYSPSRGAAAVAGSSVAVGSSGGYSPLRTPSKFTVIQSSGPSGTRVAAAGTGGSHGTRYAVASASSSSF